MFHLVRWCAGKLSIVALSFLMNRFNSYMQMPFAILSVNINVLEAFGENSIEREHYCKSVITIVQIKLHLCITSTPIISEYYVNWES